MVEREFNLTMAQKTIDLYSLIPGAKAVQFLGITSLLVIKISLFGARGLKAFFRDGGWTAPPDDINTGPSQDPTSFTEESTTEELIASPNQLLGRIIARLSEAFGLWRT